jgi:hypothetical protein
MGDFPTIWEILQVRYFASLRRLAVQNIIGPAREKEVCSDNLGLRSYLLSRRGASPRPRPFKNRTCQFPDIRLVPPALRVPGLLSLDKKLASPTLCFVAKLGEKKGYRHRHQRSEFTGQPVALVIANGITLERP